MKPLLLVILIATTLLCGCDINAFLAALPYCGQYPHQIVCKVRP
jgi:hypothetical protein